MWNWLGTKRVKRRRRRRKILSWHARKKRAKFSSILLLNKLGHYHHYNAMLSWGCNKMRLTFTRDVWCSHAASMKQIFSSLWSKSAEREKIVITACAYSDITTPLKGKRKEKKSQMLLSSVPFSAHYNGRKQEKWRRWKS